jgi:hypothetical protein
MNFGQNMAAVRGCIVLQKKYITGIWEHRKALIRWRYRKI